MILRKKALFYFLLLLALGFAGLGKDCKKRDAGGMKTPSSRDAYMGVTFNNYQSRTAKGVLLTSLDRINPNIMPLIDQGFDEVFDVASRVYGYRNGLDHKLYRVNLFRRSPLCENPGFVIYARAGEQNPYDNHPAGYDKDPRIGWTLLCAAGLTEGEDVYRLVFVNDLSMAQAVGRMEPEHTVIYHNNRQLWQDTLFHVTGGHPLLTDPNQKPSAESASLPIEPAVVVLPEAVEIKTENAAGETVETLTLPKGSKVSMLLTK